MEDQNLSGHIDNENFNTAKLGTNRPYELLGLFESSTPHILKGPDELLGLFKKTFFERP